jgi:hypothetical protein
LRHQPSTSQATAASRKATALPLRWLAMIPLSAAGFSGSRAASPKSPIADARRSGNLGALWMLGNAKAVRHSAPRLRIIQDCLKDWPTALRHVERAEDRPQSGSAIPSGAAGRKVHVRREAPGSQKGLL